MKMFQQMQMSTSSLYGVFVLLSYDVAYSKTIAN